jgi:ribonuclease P protein component
MRYRPIRRNGEFGRVYARGKSYVNQALVLYVLKTRSKRTRVGLTATKKIGHAVQRPPRHEGRHRRTPRL